MPTIIKTWNRDAPKHGGLDDPAANLALPVRAHNAIRNTLTGSYPHGIPDLPPYLRDDGPVITVGDVDRTSDATLARTPNFGGKSLRALRAEIDRYLRRGSN